MSETMIKTENLSKYYGSFAAIEKISFEISKGEIVAFLGPNGAGKSTTMKILTGYLSPSEGTAQIGKFNMATDRLAAAEILGYLPENGPLYLDLTPRESLGFIGAVRGMKGAQLKTAIERVTEQCGLHEVLDKAINKLSKGYRQRVGMSQVLLHEPEVIIMDEPTTGLDPNQIRTVRDTIRELGKSKTVLYSTHILQEVEAVADRVIFVNEGCLVFDGTVKEFKEKGKLDETFQKLSLVTN
ncbi:MAG: ABC transporter ATP-binding protein [Lentisphaeria bacterium]|nr:ABC transporter ATP-binding protein [Lentisphaeria bacterium]